jgi:hypothetical protein
MPYAIEGSTIRIAPQATIEEAEDLHAALRGIEEPVFDLGAAGHVHTAIVQLIMASKARVRGLPDDPVLWACLGERLLA